MIGTTASLLADSTSDPALVLDEDDDNDGIKDHLDEFPLVASTDPLDRLIDPDGDYDGDGVPNASDHFPQDASESMDLDFDGLGNNADDDDDGDGVLDEDDAFRFNPFETVDSDGDGVGDFVDAAPNNGDVTSLVISEALAGIIDTNLRACLANRTQGLAYAGELTELVCGYDLGESIEVYDLTGLRAFHQLTYIELKRGAPTSLEPIHGLYKLQRLRLNNLAWDFHDFDQLAPFYSLTEFGSDSFQNVQPEELEILGRLPRLTNLSVGSYFSLKTLSFVSKMPRLRQLWISYSEIEDYSQLESLYYLKTLWLDFKAGPKFSDLSFLTFSPNLKELGLGGANLEGLTGIEQARNLENLTAWEGPISDISVLADLAHLKNLNLFQQRISDITPLAGLQQLETVNLAENNLSSLGTVLINWGYPTSFNLSGNPLPCSEIEAARTNANLTIQFDGDCLKIGEDADADNDGISDESDAFPNDPAASVDTDGDGKPDDWNEGKSAADSTSDPALVLDNDDDNDGVADVDDAYPRNASLQSNRDLKSIGDEFLASVGTVNGSAQNRPAVGGLSDGSFVVTWMVDSTGMATDIIGQRYANDGSKLGSEFLVNTTTIDYQSNPAVAGLASGGFVVVWDSYNQDGSSYGIYGQRFTGSGVKNGEEFRINTFINDAQLEPAVAGLVNGGFVVTWRSDLQDGSNGGIFGQRYAIDGAKLGNEFSVNTTTEGYQEQTLITASKRGGFVVTWISYGADGSIDADIYGQRYAQDGARSGEEFKVNTSTTKAQAGHSLSDLQDGGFVATWSSLKLGGSDIDVFGQRFTAAGSPSGIEFQINTFKSNDQTHPFVTGLSEGGFVVTWNSDGQDAGNDGVYGQYFAGNGMPSGDEFKVNSEPLESHSLSSSIAQDDGSFLVFWTSYDLEGYATGIYGQRYKYSAGFLPCNDYCVQTEDRMLYRFALRSEAETFPFFQDMTDAPAGEAGGATGGGAFEFELNTASIRTYSDYRWRWQRPKRASTLDQSAQRPLRRR